MGEVFLDRADWVLSGSLDGWGDSVAPLLDFVVFVVTPTEVRLRRLREREARHFGGSAVARGGWRHDETEAFIEWASHYDDGSRNGRNLPRHEAWIKRLRCRCCASTARDASPISCARSSLSSRRHEGLPPASFYGFIKPMTNEGRAEATRRVWLETIERHRHDRERPGSERYWSPALDTASRDSLRAIQDDKITAVAPFLYENSPFYRRRFDRLGLVPSDIRSVDDLVAKWPVLDKAEMVEDAAAHPPYGTFTAMSDALWVERGWMMFSSSGSTGAPRVFRYSHVDRELWAWANARAMHAMDFRHGDTVFMITGFGPHVWAWGVAMALAKMGLPSIPGGGMDAKARANIVLRFKPTILLCTPSYALHLGRVLQDLGADPRQTAVRTLFVGGEPGLSVPATRGRIEELWDARLVEFYGCTEAAPHAGGYSCAATERGKEPVATHLMEDTQVWEVVDPQTRAALPDGARGLTVCTNLNSESSPQLRFLVGDYTVLDRSRCACGRSHVRALGSFSGRADDLINLRGIKMFPVQIEEAVRAISGSGDEFEIVLATNSNELDVMTVRMEHATHEAPASLARALAEEIRSRCEVRVEVEVVRPGTLPKTEFKAKRVRDLRRKV